MLHEILQLGMIGFDVLGAWLRHDLGAADYRIVRVVFFSSFAAWTAFWISRTTLDLTHGLMRLVMIRVPLAAFRTGSEIVRSSENWLDRILRTFRDWQTERQRSGHNL